MARFLLLLIAGLLGAGAALTHAWLTADELDALPRDSHEASALTTQSCILFFGTTYNVCYFGAKLLRNNALAEESKKTSRVHMMLLNALFITYLVSNYLNA